MPLSVGLFMSGYVNYNRSRAKSTCNTSDGENKKNKIKKAIVNNPSWCFLSVKCFTRYTNISMIDAYLENYFELQVTCSQAE